MVIAAAGCGKSRDIPVESSAKPKEVAGADSQLAAAARASAENTQPSDPAARARVSLIVEQTPISDSASAAAPTSVNAAAQQQQATPNPIASPLALTERPAESTPINPFQPATAGDN
jgi:hypothetical protein